MCKVTVAILNYNGEEMLGRFLPSVLQNSPGARIVVADNASTDGSVAFMKEHFPGVELILLDRNYGFAEGYNRVMEHVDTEYVLLLNSDVEVTPGWLEPLVAALDADENVVACQPKVLDYKCKSHFEYAGAAGGFIDFLGYPFCRGRLLRSIEQDRGQYDDEREVFWASGAALCCRLACYRELGGLDGSYFAHMEEIDLAWRMQLAGWQLRIVPQSVVYHYGGGTLQTDSPRKIFLNHRNNLAMLVKCAPVPQLVVAMLLRPWLDLLAALTYLVQGHPANFWAVFRAWGSFLGRVGELSKARREVVRKADGSKHIYRGSLLWRYLWGCRTYLKL